MRSMHRDKVAIQAPRRTTHLFEDAVDGVAGQHGGIQELSRAEHGHVAPL